MQRDMTKGPIARQLILFALPLLATSLIQQLYNTVDLIFVGQILGKEAAAAVGASSLLVTCMVGFFTGISVGMGVVAAKAFGGSRYGDLQKTIHTAMGIALFGGAVLTAVGIVFAPVFLAWLDTPADILELATTYIRLYFVSLISMIAYNFAAGILRALGNSRSPMLYQLIGGLSNVAANTLFIWILDMGVKGAAIATVISQSVAMLLAVWHLCNLPGNYALELKKIRIELGKTKEILVIGVPSGIQAMVITLSNLIVQAHINGLGVNDIAAFTAYFKVELFIYLPIMAFGQAATTFTGQNIGAGRLDRVRRGFRVGVLVGLLTVVSLSAVLLLLSDFAFGLFVPEAEVIAIGGQIVSVTFPLYFLYLLMEMLSSTIRGAGQAMPPMVIILVCVCGLRILLLTLLDPWIAAASDIAIVYPITWAVTVLALFGYYKTNRWVPKRLKTV